MNLFVKPRVLARVLVVCLSGSLNVWAQNLYVADNHGNYAKLTIRGAALAVTPLSDEELRAAINARDEALRLEDGEKVYSTGATKIVGHDIFMKVHGEWVRSPLQAPPNPRMSYLEAVPDAEGNLFVKLGGAAAGINYVSKHGNVHIARGTGLVESFEKLLPVREHTGIMALRSNGELLGVDVDTRTGRSETSVIATGVRDIVEFGAHQIAVTDIGLSLITLRGLRSVDPGLLHGNLRVFNADNRIQRETLVRLSTGALTRVQRAAGVEPQPVFNDLDRSNEMVQVFLKTLSRVITDEVARDEFEGKRVRYFGRDEETEKAIQRLSRVYGPNPVLVGEAGVGKTAIAELLAQKAFYGEYPAAYRTLNALNDSIWIETSPDKISLLALSDSANAQAAAVRTFIDSVLAVQKLVEKPLVVFIDEVHMLSKSQLDALKPILENKRSPIRFVMATTNREYGLMVKRDAAVERRMPRVEVAEFSPEDTRKLLLESVVPYYEEAYRSIDGQRAVITEDAVDKVIDRAHEYLPNGSFPEGPIKLLMDATTYQHVKSEGAAPRVDALGVADFVKRELRLPLDPDAPDFDQKIAEIRRELKQTVVEQEPLIDSLVDNFRAIVDADRVSKKHRVILVTGVTGSGKTFGVEEAAKRLVGASRHLVIDGTKYANANGNISILMNDLLGAPPGIISSDETSGILPEFLAGRGRGFNMITINEADKMDPEAFKKLMEMFDRGELQAADGKIYKLGRSIISLTTNKGSDEIYPRRHVQGMTRAEILRRAKEFSVSQIKNFFLKPDPNNLYSDKVLPPEVVQRFDDAVVALPPSEEGVKKILANEIERRSESLRRHKGVVLDISPTVLELVVGKNYDPVNGVRNPKRVLHKLIDEAIAQVRSEQGLGQGDHLVIDSVQEGRTSFAFTAKKESASESLRITAGELDMATGADPLEDPTIRELLTSLETRFGQDVFGQEDMINRVSELIRNQRLTKQLKQPVTALLLGTTGTGKSEMAKAVARKYFGSESRMKMFNMGDVKSDFDFNNIFTPPKGVVGSQKIGPFEEFVRANEKIGGVLLLDEMGNMGGMNPAVKKELLMKFYSIFDEGTWSSPVTGEEYDLRNILIIMTSNEGQELFKQTPSDDLRLATWKGVNKQEILHDLLTEKHGWPEALVARLDLVTMAKPLVEADRTFISDKFLGSFIRTVKENSPIDRVVVEGNFHQMMGEVFFSHTKGARLMKKVIEKGPLASLFNQARMELSVDDLAGAQIRVGLADSYYGRYYSEATGGDKRTVTFKVTVEKDGRVLGVYESEDLAGLAAPKRLVSAASAVKTAYHEAGHAIVNITALTGTKTAFVTIKGAGGYNGYARHEQAAFAMNPNRSAVIANIAMIWSGQQAQIMAGIGKDAGWSSDLEKARSIAQRAVTEWGLVDKPHLLPVKDGAVIVEDRRVQREISKLIDEGIRFSEQLLRHNWDLIEEMKDYLVRHGEIEGEALDALVRRAEIPEGAVVPRSVAASGVDVCGSILNKL